MQQVHTCPRCRFEFRDEDAELAQQIAAWEAECANKRYPIASGRVSEEHAALLLGMAPKTLAGYRKKSGKGPRAHHLPVNGSRWSYSLVELAEWQAAHQQDEPEEF
jgi:hypothetical protein